MQLLEGCPRGVGWHVCEHVCAAAAHSHHQGPTAICCEVLEQAQVAAPVIELLNVGPLVRDTQEAAGYADANCFGVQGDCGPLDGAAAGQLFGTHGDFVWRDRLLQVPLLAALGGAGAAAAAY